jgi:hypothetical protein
MRVTLKWRRTGDIVAGALLFSAALWYFLTPEIVERKLTPLVYDRDGNTYASLQCVREGNTAHRFLVSNARPELKDSAELLEWNDLYQFAIGARTGRLVEYVLPEPDPRCVKVNGFTETVTRWEYFFGSK